jgi:drug/metabolite transporter (DMT)-like permease
MNIFSFAPLALLISTWVLLGELIQGLLDGWAHPWLLTYCIKSGFTLCLMPYALLRHLRLRSPAPPPLPRPAWALARAGAALSPISTACSLCWYVSLTGTSFAGNSAVYQAASAFALLFSALLLREAVTLRKLVCVAGAIAGVALISFGAVSGGGRDTLPGYAWVVMSTALYALYEVLYARLTVPPPGDGGSLSSGGGGGEGASAHLLGASPPPPPLSDPAAAALLKAEVAALVLGSLGAASFLTQWPLFFVAHAAGWERWEWPPPTAKGRLVALNMGLDSVYNLALLWGISTTSAFAMQLASTLVVPAGIFADFCLHGELPTPMAACGVVMVCAAVAALDCEGCRRCPRVRELFATRRHAGAVELREAGEG